MEPEHDESIRETITDIARRLPRYAQLTARLVADGRMSARQRAPLIGAIGYGVSPIDLIPGIIPILGQLDDLLVMFGAIQYALNSMQPEAAEAHLSAVGLTREQVEADIRDTRRVAKRVAAIGAKRAASAAETGARVAGRLAGKGVRAFRAFRSRVNTPESDPTDS